MEVVQPGGKDELLVGTTQHLEAQDSRPNLQASTPTHLLLPAPKGLGLRKPPWLCVQPALSPSLGRHDPAGWGRVDNGERNWAGVEGWQVMPMVPTSSWGTGKRGEAEQTQETLRK